MRRWVWITVVVLLTIGLLAWTGLFAAEPAPRLLTGEVWQTLSPDAKLAFVWGVGNLLEFERTRASTAEPSPQSFIPFLVEGLKGKPIADVVAQIDRYYAAHPAEIKRPVIDAIFQAVVLPEISAQRKGGRAR